MAPPTYADLKKKIAEMQQAEDGLKAQIAALTANPGAAGTPEAAGILAAKEKAETDAAELQKQVDELTAELAALTAEAPKTVKLVRPYAFFDEDGVFRSWEAGEVSDEADIAILRDRGVI